MEKETTAVRLQGMIINIMLAKTPEARAEARRLFNEALKEVPVNQAPQVEEETFGFEY
jgi:hypothetical protein